MKFFSISVLCLALLSVVFAENFYTGTWSSSQYWTGEMPENVPVEGSSIRQIVRVSIPGETLRFHFSNIIGDTELEIKAVHVAKSAGQGTGSIIVDTDTEITFNGKPEVTIPAGGDLISDDIDFHIDALDELAITIFYGKIPVDLFTSHAGARTNSYIEVGNVVSKETFTQDNKFPRWYTIAAIDVVDNERKYAAVLCYGDSITDGRGSTTDKQNRWSDILAEKLQSNPATQHLAVLNQGIGGSSLYGENSIRWPTGLGRFQKDVAEQVNVKYMIVLYGVNDIVYGGIDTETLIGAFKELIKRAHELGIIVYGSPILPFKSNDNWTEEFNQIKLAVNDWIINTPASEGGFDAVIDMATPVSDPKDDQVLLYELSDGDGLHPNHLGYEVMGNAIPYELFINEEDCAEYETIYEEDCTETDAVVEDPTDVEFEPFETEVVEEPTEDEDCTEVVTEYVDCAETDAVVEDPTDVEFEPFETEVVEEPTEDEECTEYETVYEDCAEPTVVPTEPVVVPTEPVVVEPTVPVVVEPTEPVAKCLAEVIGYPCCDEGIDDVYDHDEHGDWGYDFIKREWCGLTPLKAPEGECWSEKYGYPCCETCYVYEEDKNGKWGYEHHQWCGIQSYCSF